MTEFVRPNVRAAFDILWLISHLPTPTVIRPTRFRSELLEGLVFPDHWQMDTDEYIRRMMVVESVKVTASQNEESHYRRIALGATSAREWYAPQFVIGLTHQAGHVHACDVYATPPVEIESAIPSESAELIRIGKVSSELLAAEAHGEPIHELSSHATTLAIRDLAMATGSVMLSANVYR